MMAEHEVHATVTASHAAATIARRRGGVVANLCTRLDESSIAGTPECEALKAAVREVVNNYADGISALLRSVVADVDPRVIELIADLDAKLDRALEHAETG